MNFALRNVSWYATVCILTERFSVLRKSIFPIIKKRRLIILIKRHFYFISGKLQIIQARSELP